MRVLPLRIEVDAVEQMDAAWRARGIKSRTAFLRKALGSYLVELGAPEAARLLDRGA
jgi:metal-responsive CopG/Arc/MetJ family transcriptional regulator